MASQDQMNQMLILLQQQMSQLQTLHAENTELRASAVDPTTTKAKTKAPDRPTVNTNTDEREWELFKDSWTRYKNMTGIFTI